MKNKIPQFSPRMVSAVARRKGLSYRSQCELEGRNLGKLLWKSWLCLGCIIFSAWTPLILGMSPGHTFLMWGVAMIFLFLGIHVMHDERQHTLEWVSIRVSSLDPFYKTFNLSSLDGWERIVFSVRGRLDTRVRLIVELQGYKQLTKIQRASLEEADDNFRREFTIAESCLGVLVHEKGQGKKGFFDDAKIFLEKNTKTEKVA